MQADPGAAAPLLMLLLLIPIFVIGLVQVACLIMVIVKMFQKGETGMGIACAVLSACTGIGAVIAFVYRWVKSSEWDLKRVMVTWTACIVLNIVLALVAVMAGAFAIPLNVEARPQVQNF